MSRPRRSRARFPWERDPGDLEANYKKPVEFHERARLGLKGAIVVASFLVIKEWTEDRVDVGAKLLVVVGIVLVLVGIIDLVETRRGKLEHVFIEDRSAQLWWHGGLAASGAMLAVVASVALL
jgi:hypothetical protein